MNAKIIAAIAMCAFAVGWQIQSWRYGAQLDRLENQHAQALQHAEARARAKERALRDAAAEIDRLSEQDRDRVRVVTKVVEKEVVRYEKDPGAGRCVLPDDWVRIHNAATQLPSDP